MTLLDYVDHTWTLFLDRDGVINEKIEGDYVREWERFEFLPGSREALTSLAGFFKRIVVVTNQQGIGKNLFTEDQLNLVHEKMLQEVNAAGGRIDKIYFAPYLESENHPTRKPNTGMAHLAKADFPEINFRKSIMVGDSDTDIEFGKRLGMLTIFIHPEKRSPEADLSFKSLLEFSQALTK
jgi:histidinol-phosphate phosphatase family protein